MSIRRAPCELGSAYGLVILQGGRVIPCRLHSSLHRSAIFLIVFLVFHCLGNLTALFGRDAYLLTDSVNRSLLTNPSS